MFFILGVESKEKVIKTIRNIICKGCGQMSSYDLLLTYSFLHLFFIPIFKWNKKYYLRSRCCNSIFEISKETFDRMNNQQGEYININDFELKEVYNPNNGTAVCSSCGKRVDSGFEYCPHCGSKL